MRKFLLPIINLVNVILVSIAWGLSGKTAVIDAARADAKCGNIYEVVWMGTKANAVGIVGFFLFIFAVALTLVAFLPLKSRKYVTCCGGLMYVAAGVLFLLAPAHYDRAIIKPELTGALIAIAVLIFVAGAFSLAMSALEFLGKKNDKSPSLKEKLAKVTKLDKLYISLSLCSIALSLFILIFILCKFVLALIFVYLGLVLAYAVAILVFEIKRNKKAK